MAFSLLLLPALVGTGVEEPAPDFDREVRPILSEHCFACHGPDEAARESGLRLDTPEGPRDLETLAGLPVRLVSGIGNPAAFEATVRDLGAEVVEHRVHPDHHDFRAADLPPREGPPVLCTLKDASKLEALGLRPWVLEVRLEVTRGASWLEELLDLLPPGPELGGEAR